MKTFSQKSESIKREWYLIDASTLPLGKLAVVIADKLMGKSKVTYTPHVDNGDYVVVINAKNLQVTGNKMVDKKYYRHSGFPGGLKELKLEEVIESLRVNFRHPIVAKKMKPNGYYLPRSEEERQAGLAPYRRQILTEQKNLAAVMNVDLEKYWEDSA